MNTSKLLLPGLLVALFGVTGCPDVREHAEGTREALGKGDRLTVGKVQREIRIGMSGADVLQVLGSPNLVSTDEERREVWVYDKIATDRVVSKSVAGIWILVGASRSAGASSTSQRTLTVIIKFNKQSKVRDFAYHTSRF